MSYTVSTPFFNMNDSEQGLKMQPEIHLSINMVKF